MWLSVIQYIVKQLFELKGDTTSLESSGGGYTMPSSRGLNPGDRVYATSVPVSIPLFENTKNSYDLESDEDQVIFHSVILSWELSPLSYLLTALFPLHDCTFPIAWCNWDFNYSLVK